MLQEEIGPRLQPKGVALAVGPEHTTAMASNGSLLKVRGLL